MDVSSFMGGSFLTQLDLPQQSQVWTIRDVRQELVGSDQKVVTYFAEHQKGLGLNKVNLRTIAQAYSTSSQVWIGKPLELYRDQTQFQGRVVPCIRVRIPEQLPTAPQPVLAPQPAPGHPPVPASQPAQQLPAPWEQPSIQDPPSQG